jgi:hypothetical protein
MSNPVLDRDVSKQRNRITGLIYNKKPPIVHRFRRMLRTEPGVCLRQVPI